MIASLTISLKYCDWIDAMFSARRCASLLREFSRPPVIITTLAAALNERCPFFSVRSDSALRGSGSLSSAAALDGSDQLVGTDLVEVLSVAEVASAKLSTGRLHDMGASRPGASGGADARCAGVVAGVSVVPSVFPWTAAFNPAKNDAMASEDQMCATAGLT